MCGKVKVILNVLMPLQIVHQLIERKQSEIRKVHPGLVCFNEVGNQIDIKDIPGICKFFHPCDKEGSRISEKEKLFNYMIRINIYNR